MEKIVDLVINDDYSILKTPNYYFYYGYEFDTKEFENGDSMEIYGFEAIKNIKNKEKKYRKSLKEMEKIIGCPKCGSCEDLLLFGIGMFLEEVNNDN